MTYMTSCDLTPTSVEHGGVGGGVFEGKKGNADVVYSASLWLGLISEDFSSFLAVFFDLRQQDLSEWQLISFSTSVRWVLGGKRVLKEGQSEGGSCGLFLLIVVW